MENNSNQNTNPNTEQKVLFNLSDTPENRENSTSS